MKQEFIKRINKIWFNPKFSKTKSILKVAYNLFPFQWIITLLSKVFIVGGAMSYLNSIGALTIFIRIILNLWILMSFKSMIETFIWSIKEYQYNKFIDKQNKEDEKESKTSK